MSRAIHLLPLWVCRACYRVILTLTFFKLYHIVWQNDWGNSELEMARKEAFVDEFEIVPRYFSVGPEEKHKNLIWSVLRPRFDLGISRVQIRSAIASAKIHDLRSC